MIAPWHSRTTPDARPHNEATTDGVVARAEPCSQVVAPSSQLERRARELESTRHAGFKVDLEYILQDAVLRLAGSNVSLHSAILLHFRLCSLPYRWHCLRATQQKKTFQWWFKAKPSIISHPEAKFVHPFEREHSNILTSVQVQWMHETPLLPAVFNGITFVNCWVIFSARCAVNPLGGFLWLNPSKMIILHA